MSFVIATPDLVLSAAQNLADIRSSLAEAATAAAGPTTGVAAAAQDEVSVATPKRGISPRASVVPIRLMLTS
jgi:hypothetical protein